MLRSASAAGLAPLSFELETIGLLIAVSYGFLMGLPFSAFGETVVSGRAETTARAQARRCCLLTSPYRCLLTLQLWVPQPHCFANPCLAMST